MFNSTQLLSTRSLPLCPGPLYTKQWWGACNFLQFLASVRFPWAERDGMAEVLWMRNASHPAGIEKGLLFPCLMRLFNAHSMRLFLRLFSLQDMSLGVQLAKKHQRNDLCVSELGLAHLGFLPFPSPFSCLETCNSLQCKLLCHAHPWGWMQTVSLAGPQPEKPCYHT